MSDCVPVGIDLGRWNARIATSESSTDGGSASPKPKMVYNRDGQRSTRAVVDGNSNGTQRASQVVADAVLQILDSLAEKDDLDGEEVKSETDNAADDAYADDEEQPDPADAVSNFLRHLVDLASDSSHKPLSTMRVVTSLAAPVMSLTASEGDGEDGGLLHQKRKVVLEGRYAGIATEDDKEKGDNKADASSNNLCMGFILEPTAVCLAYEPFQPSVEHILVVDGGATGLKLSVIKRMTSPNTGVSTGDTAAAAAEDSEPSLSSLYSLIHHEIHEEVSGPKLVQQLVEHVAQQFCTRYRLPKDEVVCSKKVQRKLYNECETALITLLRVNANSATVHVDGLYDGLDCQVSVAKPRWDMVSSALGRKAQAVFKNLISSLGPSIEVDAVLMAGSLHQWLLPLLDPIAPSKIVKGRIDDPSESVALGCAIQAHWGMQHHHHRQHHKTSKQSDHRSCSTPVVVSPVSIALLEETLIPLGAPLPAMVMHTVSVPSSTDDGCLELFQVEPTRKRLAVFELSASSEDDEESSGDESGTEEESKQGQGDTNGATTMLLRLHLSEKGQLSVSVDGGDSITIG